MKRSLSATAEMPIAGLVLGGCSVFQPTPALSTVEAGGCFGIGLLDATLAGDPKDPRVARVIQDGQPRDVVFPNGYSARLAAELEIERHGRGR